MMEGELGAPHAGRGVNAWCWGRGINDMRGSKTQLFKELRVSCTFSENVIFPIRITTKIIFLLKVCLASLYIKAIKNPQESGVLLKRQLQRQGSLSSRPVRAIQ